MFGRKSLIILLLLFFWAISIRHLTVVPRVYEDEPWQASTGWKLATEGKFGSDLFAGFYGMEEHYYGYMPLHPLLLAAIFRLGGLGLFQARFEPVLLGMLTLALTYSLGRRLFRPEVGLLAVALLLLTRTTGTTPSQVSGILYLDIPRISRYDMLVPVLGLLALNTCWSASGGRAATMLTSRRSAFLYGFAGFLAGLAGLSHLYGNFWLVALALLLLWQRSGWAALLALGVGFLIPWLPYLLYILQAPADWAGQTRGYSPRFQFFDPVWYAQNVLSEVRRYGPGLGERYLGWLLRPGFWAFIVIVPLSLLALGRRTLRGDRPAATLFIPSVTLPLLMALLIYLKLSNYLATVFPLLALTASWGVLLCWQWAKGASVAAGRFPRDRALVRIGLIFLFIFVVAEGIWRISRLEAANRLTTAHGDYAAEIRAHLPPGGRILGLHSYWLGLPDYDYRSWAVPLSQIDSETWTPPLTVSQALEGVDPDVILIDSRVESFLEERPAIDSAIVQWMADQGFILKARVQDDTYGAMRIYLAVGSTDHEP